MQSSNLYSLQGKNSPKTNNNNNIYSWGGEFELVPLYIRLATKRMSWSLIKIEQPDQLKTRVQAQILLPDGRIARVEAWPEVRDGTGVVVLAVGVGHFGDPPLEQRFLKECKSLATSELLRPRGETFRLPGTVPEQVGE